MHCNVLWKKKKKKKKMKIKGKKENGHFSCYLTLTEALLTDYLKMNKMCWERIFSSCVRKFIFTTRTPETNGVRYGVIIDKRELSRPRFVLCYPLKPRAEADNHFGIWSDIKIASFVCLYKAISDHKHHPFRQTDTLFSVLLEIKHSYNGQVDWKLLFT